MRNFKNFLGILLIAGFAVMFSATSCNKEEDSSSADCHCGGITSFDYNSAGYYVQIKNYCTNNYKWFSVSYSDWLYADYGDRACSASGSSWKITPTGDACEKEQTGEYVE